MSNRILVTYATRTRSTAEVAGVISAVVTRRGFIVDLKSVREKPTGRLSRSYPGKRHTHG
jgi:menaquinone-dependent protoporphyrinogen IX oxidase